MSKVKIALYGILALSVVGLFVWNVWFGVVQKQKRQEALSQPRVSSEVASQAAAHQAAIEASKAAEFEVNFPPIKAPVSSSSAQSATPDGSSSEAEMVVEQPEYVKPEPPKEPPASSKPDDPANPAKPPKPAKNKDGDTRVNADGKTEMYIGGFGWIVDSGEPNITIPAENAGTGEVIGF